MWREAGLSSEQKSHHNTFLLCLWDILSCTSTDQNSCSNTMISLDLGKCVRLSLPFFIWHNSRKQSLLLGQVPFNLIQLLLEVLAGALHHFYFMKDTLHRKPRRHPTLHVYLSTSMLSAFKADSLNGMCPPLTLIRKSLWAAAMKI